MADPTPKKITDLNPISTGSIQIDDLMALVDVHDPEQGSTGSTKKFTLAQLFAVLPTLAPAKGGTGLTTIGDPFQVLAVAAGGTGLEYRTPTVGQLANFPSQSGHGGQYLTTDGITLSWATVATGGGGTGNVTSVGLSLPAIFALAGSPITTSGTFAVTLATQSANRVWAGPTSGGSAAPDFRMLVAADIPTISESQVSGLTSDLAAIASTISAKEPTIAGGTTAQYWRGDKSWQTLATAVLAALPTQTGHAGQYLITDGSTVSWSAVAGGGGGTVTSVGLNLPASIFTVTGSPVTGAATLTGSLATQSANQVWAGPTSGGAAVPVFRVLAVADLPTLGLTIATSRSPTIVATDAATITFDLAAGQWYDVTLGGNRTLAVSNPAVGQNFSVEITQDATGSRTVTWWSGIKWAGGSPPTLSTAAGAVDLFTFRCKSAGVYRGMVAGQGFA